MHPLYGSKKEREKRSMKKVITVIIAVVLVAAAITGYCVWSFNSKYISKKEALGIAVADAGVSMTEVTDTDIEFEKEHGIARYEVDFEVGFTEYKYLLDPATGEIIDKRTEID